MECMPTEKQKLGDLGEKLVAKHVACPSCKRDHSLKLLPKNFKCADLICGFCGYLAQVKTSSSKDPSNIPDTILGAARGRLSKAGISFCNPNSIGWLAGPKRGIAPESFQSPTNRISRPRSKRQSGPIRTCGASAAHTYPTIPAETGSFQGKPQIAD